MSKNLAEGEKALPSLRFPLLSFAIVRSRRWRRSFIFTLAILFLFAPGWTPAQDTKPESETDADSTEEVEMEPIIVIGDRIDSERELENPSKFMTVVKVGEASRMATVSEELQSTVGVQINSFGGMGGMSTVSIRGSSASQVAVYLDGVPMNRAATGVTNLEDLPLDNLAYIEVYRGFTPPDFGQAGIGGAVNLVTGQGGGKRRLASGSYGSFDTTKILALASGPAGPVNLFVFGGMSRSNGDFMYDNDNGTPLNGNDDFIERRVNNDFISYDLTFRAGGYAGPWELAAIGTGHDKDQGLPGLGASQAEHSRLGAQRLSLTLSARNRGLLDGRLDLTVGADGLWEDQLFKDPEGELGSGGPRKVDNRMDTAGGRVKAIWSNWDRTAVLTTYAEYRQESYLPTDLIPERVEGKEQRRILLTGVVQLELTDPTGVLTVQTSVRQEEYYNHLSGDPYFQWSDNTDNRETLHLTSPSIGVIYRVNPHFFLKGNAGRFHRVPTFNELFGDRGVTVGNASLKPEQGVNWDVGFVYHGPDLYPITSPYVEYAFFQSRVSDMIVFFQNSQRTVMATNIGEALIGGHEISVGCGLYESWRLSGNYTFQSAVDRSEVPYWRGNALPMRPMHEAYGRAEYRPIPALKLWGDATYISGNYWDRANLYEVPDRRIYNLGAWVEVYSKGDLGVAVSPEIKNLSDGRIADVAGYPLPGRSYYASLEAKW